MRKQNAAWCLVHALVVLSLLPGTSRAQSTCPPGVRAPTQLEMDDAFRSARDRGALWRFEKDGRPGYLYGTIHVGKFEWAMPGRLVGQALRDADTIAVEADMTDPT